MTQRTLAIGDIHGCDVALETMLGDVQPTPEDTIVVLGDVVDRGPNSRRVIELLIELGRTCDMKFIQGNHEEMMLDAYNSGAWMNDWLLFGGRETLESYGDGFDDVPPQHWEFLETGLDYWETETEIYVHANVDPNVPLNLQGQRWLRWVHLRGSESPHVSGRRVICGHTAQRSGQPLLMDGRVCIDTWVYGEGRLSCLDVSNDMLYQSTQAGDTFDTMPIGAFA